jgi:hypothetical protein
MRVGRILELLHFLYVQRIKGFDPPSAPELDEETLERLTAELKRCKAYLEFGSGGSTMIADRLGVPTVSIESDRFFARTISSALKGTTVSVVPVYIGFTGEWGWPLLKRPTPSRIARWRRYVETGFERSSPDLILIDGRFRVACGLEAARRTNGATVIVDDYFNRPHYRSMESYLGPPERVGRAAIFKSGNKKIPAEAISKAVTDPS